ncbi:MAG: hypothetical protein GX357_01145, partial [Firmicutes bacterium]|nr:hypothetical protein [Bacillota bacterium]
MKIGIIGPGLSGKSTLFRLLTGAGAGSGKGGIPQGAARVPDERVEQLAEIFKPKKTTFATIEFADFPPLGNSGQISGEMSGRLKALDALAVVVRAHRDPSVPWPAEPLAPNAAFSAFMEEMILADLVHVETLLGRKKDKRTPEEQKLLETCQTLLEEMKPLYAGTWTEDDLPYLRNFAFLSSRPILVAVNLDEEQMQDLSYSRREELRELCREAGYPLIEFCGTLEMEISQMAKEDQVEFMAAYGLK